jgi:uncharacterized GH25 family protein
MKRLSWIVLLVGLTAPRVLAHDFWIEPSTYRPGNGAVVTAALRVGQDFAGDPVPRSAQLLDTFDIRDTSGERPVAGIENRDPAGYVRVGGGTSVLRYRSKGSPLEQTPEKFAQFLREEGLQHIVPGTPTRGHHERFYRYAKTIVGAGAGFDAVFGDRMELVPVTDPRTSGTPSFRVLFEGKPLANALVTAIARDDGRRVSARTDRRGRASLPLSGNDVWLVKSTHLVPAGLEWESLWASVTFSR